MEEKDSKLHIRLGKGYYAAPSKNALCGIPVSSMQGGWPDQSIAVFTSDPDGPWSIERLQNSGLEIRGKPICGDCVDRAHDVIPLLSLKGE
jgi:hypothetical protein